MLLLKRIFSFLLPALLFAIPALGGYNRCAGRPLIISERSAHCSFMKAKTGPIALTAQGQHANCTFCSDFPQEYNAFYQQ